ncbi:hypothetical protein ACOJBO_04570 [Rhizobium beringeri]
MANLRKTISRIQARQTELGTELLVFTSTGVRIKPDAFVCDLFELAKPDGDGALEKLRRLVAVLRQDFLAVLADQSVSTRQWIAGQRDKHMAILVDALKTALPAARSREDVSLIKEAALRIFRDAPDDENIRRILLEAYESEGQLENARRLFDASRHGLESALDVGLDVRLWERSARSLPAVNRRRALWSHQATAAVGLLVPCPVSCCCHLAGWMRPVLCRCSPDR